jgi:hypothetical protein
MFSAMSAGQVSEVSAAIGELMQEIAPVAKGFAAVGGAAG